MWHPVQKVGCSIQRINDPAARRVLAFFHAAFFSHPAICRASAHQLFLDDRFGAQIGFAHKIACALHGNLKRFNLAEILHKAAARLTGGFDHHVKIRAGLHGSSSFGGCQTAAIRLGCAPRNP